MLLSNEVFRTVVTEGTTTHSDAALDDIFSSKLELVDRRIELGRSLGTLQDSESFEVNGIHRDEMDKIFDGVHKFYSGLGGPQGSLKEQIRQQRHARTSPVEKSNANEVRGENFLRGLEDTHSSTDAQETSVTSTNQHETAIPTNVLNESLQSTSTYEYTSASTTVEMPTTQATRTLPVVLRTSSFLTENSVQGTSSFLTENSEQATAASSSPIETSEQVTWNVSSAASDIASRNTTLLPEPAAPTSESATSPTPPVDGEGPYTSQAPSPLNSVPNGPYLIPPTTTAAPAAAPTPQPTSVVTLPGLEAIGPVTVIYPTMTLGVPSETDETVYNPIPDVTIIVPPHTWVSSRRAAPQPLTVTVFLLPEGLPEPGTVCGAALDLGPADQQLAGTILVSLPCSSSGTPPPVPYRYVAASGSWALDQAPPTNVTAGVWARIAVLGTHAAFQVQPAGASPVLAVGPAVGVALGAAAVAAAAVAIAFRLVRGAASRNTSVEPDSTPGSPSRVAAAVSAMGAAARRSISLHFVSRAAAESRLDDLFYAHNLEDSEIAADDEGGREVGNPVGSGSPYAVSGAVVRFDHDELTADKWATVRRMLPPAQAARAEPPARSAASAALLQDAVL